MKIKSIYIDGLHNAVAKTYNFGDIVYLFGNNGAGKSTVLQAIQFALLGYIPGTAKNSREAILRHSPKEEITVKLELDDVTITRKTWKTGNRIDIDPVTYDISALTKDIELPIFNFNDFVGQTANKLKEYFIKNILPTTNGELNWQQILEESISDCNFQDRDRIIEYGMTIVSDLEGDVLDQVIQANTKFKAEQTFNKSEQQRLQNTVDSLIYYDDYVGPTNADDLTSQILVLSSLRDEVIKYDAAVNSTYSLQHELDGLKIRLDALGSKEDYEKSAGLLTQLNQRYSALSEEISKKNKHLSGIQAMDKVTDSIINSNGICPYTKDKCNSMVEKIASMQKDSLDLKESIKEEIAQIENLNIELNLIHSNILNTEKMIKDYQALQDRISVLQSTMGTLPPKPNTDKSVFDLDAEIEKLSQSRIKLQANIKYNETIEKITNMKFESELQGTALAAWVKKTDTNGLQTTLMIQPFNELAATMTEYIQKMYGRTDITAHFNLSTKANSFSFGLIRDKVYIPYDLLSSGEKCLYALALMICITNRSASPLKLLLCDDIFDHLDTNTIENTFTSLKNVSDIQFIFAGVKDCKNAEDVMLRIG